MLQHIREKSQGIVAWTIVILLIATFALWGVHSYLTTEKNNDAAAYVNHHPIPQSAVNTAYQRMRQQRQLELGANFSLNPSVEKELKAQALNDLIVSQVLIDAAYKAGYRVTTNQVDEALVRIPAFQVNGQFSVDRFHDILNGILYTQEQFLADMRNSMLINQAQGGYVNSAFALPDEVDEVIKLVNQKRDISYVIVPAARFTKNVIISPDEIKQYYNAHQSEFRSPEQVSIDYLTLSLNGIKKNLRFDASKLQQYYENNLSNYTTPAQWHVATILIKMPEEKTSRQNSEAAFKKAQEIYLQLQSGQAFAKLAEKYSEDAASASKGGELEWFRAGTLDPAFEKATAALQKTGDFSKPVKTAYGFSIIKLLGEKKPAVLPFEQVRAQVQRTLAQQQAEQIFSRATDKLSNLTYANPNSLEVAANALNLPVQTTGLFGHGGAKTGLLSNPKVFNAAFSSDVLQQGNNSDLLQLDPDTVIVLRIHTHKAASILPLADVQNTLQVSLRHKKAQQDAQKFGEMLIDEIHTKDLTLGQSAKKAGLSLQGDKNAGRYDTKVDSFILNQAFRMPYPDANGFSLKGVLLPSGDYAIISLDAIHEGILTSQDDIQRHIFQEEIEGNNGRLDYQIYVHGLMQKAKVKAVKEPAA
jgi:peptidyl-prolyl cis-trans isomerase D